MCLTAFGQTTIGKPVPVTLETLNLKELKQVLQEMGFSCTIGKDTAGKDNTYITFRAEGYTVAAQLASPKVVWLYNVFSDKTTAAVANEWNRNSRYSTAYIDTDGTSNLDMNIFIDGITRENLEAHINQFRDDVAKWAHILTTPPKQDGPARVTGEPKLGL
jgi:hypothetical protein